MLFLLILLVLIYYIITKDYKSYLTKDHSDPLSQLKEKFISGEIDEETYYKMKLVIDSE